MDLLPPEVHRLICAYLDPKDAASLRFLSRNLSVVAAEFLITRMCFHTSYTSLKRLESISNHPIFSHTIKFLVYEAALLADVRCRHEYTRHFELEHHGLEKPREPLPTCSDRERRLYLRNKAKWTQTIYKKYESYRKFFDAQKLLIESGGLEDILSQCVPKFTKLTSIRIDPIRRCSHMTSKRFIDEFGWDCASPLSGNFSRLTNLAKWTLLPADQAIKSLRKLDLSSLSPSFFATPQEELLKSAFSSLTDINISLKLADGDSERHESVTGCFHRHLSNNVLKHALSSATALKSLSISVEIVPPIYIDAADILPVTVWPHLKSISLGSLESTQCEFLELLKRQPELRDISLTLAKLSQGSWPEALEEIRRCLDLDSFSPIGYLEDPNDTWPMDLLHVGIYVDNFDELDLATAIDLWVTEKDPDEIHGDESRPPNPLSEGFGDFEESDLVRDMYGPLDFDTDMDGMSDMMDSDMDSDMDSYMYDSDVPMPDLEDVDDPTSSDLPGEQGQ